MFIVASLVGGLGTSPGMLVAARAVQGLGAALTAPNALAMITRPSPSARPATPRSRSTARVRLRHRDRRAPRWRAHRHALVALGVLHLAPAMFVLAAGFGLGVMALTQAAVYNVDRTRQAAPRPYSTPRSRSESRSDSPHLARSRPASPPARVTRTRRAAQRSSRATPPPSPWRPACSWSGPQSRSPRCDLAPSRDVRPNRSVSVERVDGSRGTVQECQFFGARSGEPASRAPGSPEATTIATAPVLWRSNSRTCGRTRKNYPRFLRRRPACWRWAPLRERLTFGPRPSARRSVYSRTPVARPSTHLNCWPASHLHLGYRSERHAHA